MDLVSLYTRGPAPINLADLLNSTYMDSLTTVQPTTVQPTTIEDTTSNVTVEPSYEEPVVISTLPELGGLGTGKYQDVPLCEEEPCEVIVSTRNPPKLTTNESAKEVNFGRWSACM